MILLTEKIVKQITTITFNIEIELLILIRKAKENYVMTIFF